MTTSHAAACSHPSPYHPSPYHPPDQPGATLLGDGRAVFDVFAPTADRVEVVLDERVVALDRDPHGVHRGTVEDVAAGSRYRYRLHREGHDPVDRADPASRWQPDGVHGPSAVDDPAGFVWNDAGFAAPPLHQQVLYELHVGTFSSQGTFDGVIAQLDHLVELGVTTLELLPVWQFPGGRNWGYDGVLPSAVQDTYGGPDGLRRLVDAAHTRGLAVILDVVYNHIGPEGNHLAEFGPYFTDHYETPWGPGLNTDGPGSDAVRRWVVANAVGWVRDFHLDGFRLDAVHGIVDQSAVHLLEQLTTAVHDEGERLGRAVHVIAESDLSDPRLVRSVERGGYGLDAQWSDEFHHGVHVALTGERDGYYADFTGLGDLARLLCDRYAYAGRYAPARQRTIGRPARDLPYDRFVVCVQNHDQVGNRMLGERLSALTDLEGVKLAAAALLTAPFVPLVFMGEEYAEPAPFFYFVSHTDPDLVAGVRAGRRAEFADFAWRGQPPDPQDEATFADSRLNLALAGGGQHAIVFELYRTLIALRRQLDLIADPTAPDVDALPVAGREALVLHRERGEQAVLTVLNADERPAEIRVATAPGPWQVVLDTSEPRFAGPGGRRGPEVDTEYTLALTVPPRAAVLLHRKAPA